MQVRSLVNLTVDLMAVSIGRPVASQYAPPVIPQGVSIEAPINRALTAGQLQRQVAGAAFIFSVSKATAAHVLACQTPAARSEPVLDPVYLPFIDNR